MSVALATRVLLSARAGRFSIALEWKLADLWVGLFFTRTEAWLCLLPCLPIHVCWNRWDDDAPIVCPGCYAVGEEPCAPGCIDEEMRREAEDRDLGDESDYIEHEDDEP